MPQIALSAASYTAAAAPAVAATAAKVAVMASLKSVALSTITNLAFSAAMSALNPQVGPGGRTDEWVLSPDGPIPFAAGRIGVPGSVVYRKTYGPDLMYYGIPSVLSGAGPIDGFEGFMADDEVVTFDATGKAISSQYKGELWYRNSLGRQPDTALPSPTGLKSGATLPGWTSAHRLSGKASYLIVMGENSKGTAFPTGEIKPIITFRGLKGWDPRLDSTYPGGSGPCRLHDPSTWIYITNPILWALKWTLGLWEGPTGKGAPQVDYQVGGIGAKLSGIDVAAFVAAANVADANGWTVAAHPTTDDDKSQVLDAFLQAGGAIYAQRAGKISCIQRAAPRTSIVTISARDTAGPLEIDTAASRIDRINTIRPRFWSEAHRWQLTAIDEVTAEAYQAEDGAIRTRGIDYPYVPKAKQAAQLAALQIANTREGIIGVVPLKPHLQRIRPGDAFTITEPGFVLNGLKCLCLNTDYDPATGVVRVSFVSETDQKYPFAMGQSPVPPAPPELTPVDNTVTPPLPEDWVITPRPPGPGGTLVPGFDLSGVVGNSTATAIEVQYWRVPDGADPLVEPAKNDPLWVSAGTWPPTASTIPIDVEGDRYYWIGLIYIRNQNYSERTVVGPWLAGKLIADDVSQDARDKIVDKVIEDVGIQIGEGIEAGKKALERSKGNLLLTLRNAKNALDGTLKEEADREAQTSDLQDRIDIGFLIDPVAKTGIIREDVVVEGTGETFVQMNTRLVARDDENALQTAQVVIDAQAYTDREISLATANLVAAAQMETAISAALLSMEAYADAAAASATTGLASVAQVDDRIAAASLLLRGYVDAEIVEATTGLASLVQVDNKVAAADLALRSWTTNQITGATAGLASVAQVDDKVGVASLQLQSLLSAYKVEATGTFATQSSLGDVTSQAGLALSTAVAADGKASATIGFTSTVDGVLTGIFSHNDGAKPWIRVQSSVFEIVDNAVTGERFEIAGKRVKGWYANGQQAYQLG